MSVHMIAAVSDVHSGSTVAVCPPEPLELDDGGFYEPSPIQKWLWSLWETAWHERYSALLDEWKPDTQTLVINGDCMDGNHHGTPQIVSNLSSVHFRIAHELLERGPLKYRFSGIHMIRGTETHVGKSGQQEEGLARALRKQGDHKIIDDPDTGMASSFWRRFEKDGLLVDCRHHGRMGQRTHTRDAYMRLYAHEIWSAHVRSGSRPPDLCIRSHFHRYADSGRIHDMPTRVTALPAWQMLTAFGHRISIEDLGHIGLCVFVIRDGKLMEPEPIIFQPDRPTIVGG